MGTNICVKKHQINKTILSAISNLNVQRAKKIKVLDLMKNQIIEDILNGNEESALANSESYIKTENTILFYEILNSFCEQIKSKINIIEQKISIPPEMITIYASIIYAAPFCDIDEIPVLRKQIELMYGERFIKQCTTDHSNKYVHDIIKIHFCKKEISYEERIIKIESIGKLVGIKLHFSENKQKKLFEKSSKLFQESISIKDKTYNKIQQQSNETMNLKKNIMELYPSLSDFNSYMNLN